MTQVFLSHSKEDKKFAEKLAADLRSAGIPVWKAPESILPGEAWVDAIERGLTTSTHFVLLMSPAAVISKWVKVEFETAFELNVQDQMVIIPIDHVTCTQRQFWKRFQAIPKFNDNYGENLSILKKRLQTDRPAQPPAPTDTASTLHVSPHGVVGYADQPEAPSKIVLEESPDNLASPQATGLPFEPEMILIPAGPFLMGSPKSDKLRSSDELKQFELNLDYDYTIGKYPVTVGQFRHFIVAGEYQNRSHWTGAGWKWRKDLNRLQPAYWLKKLSIDDRLPIVDVSWYEAYAYTHWLAEATGRDYRLPIEAEWEKSARGGLQIPDGKGGMTKNPNPARSWPWEDEQPDNDRLNFNGNVGKTTPIGEYKAGVSPYGVFDMAGNVWEWCLSTWATQYNYPEYNDPEGESARVVRGGSWGDSARYARCSYRAWDEPFNWDKYSSFRVGGIVSISSLSTS